MINLKNTAYLSDFDLFKIVLSSADYFPGLYRFPVSWNKSSTDTSQFMTLLDYLETLHLQDTQQKHFTRDDWFNAHIHFYLGSYGINGRNDAREEDDLKKILEIKNQNWYQKPKSFSLNLIDCYSAIETIELNQSYYMLGSIIHFTQEYVFISYDHFTQCYAHKLKVSFKDAQTYIHSIYSPKSLKELFFKAAVVGHLTTKDQKFIEIICNNKEIPDLISHYQLNSYIFAAPIYNKILPIKLAKLIGVSRVNKLQ